MLLKVLPSCNCPSVCVCVSDFCESDMCVFGGLVLTYLFKADWTVCFFFLVFEEEEGPSVTGPAHSLHLCPNHDLGMCDVTA